MCEHVGIHVEACHNSPMPALAPLALANVAFPPFKDASALGGDLSILAVRHSDIPQAPPRLDPYGTSSPAPTPAQAISIVFFTETWRPDSFYDKIAANRKLGLHTLCLLDIKVKEPNLEALCRGRKVYEPPRYMSVNTVSDSALLGC